MTEKVTANHKINEEKLLTLKILQLAPLILIGIYILIIVVLYTQVGAPIFDSSSVINITTGIIMILGVTILILTYYLPLWIINSYKKNLKPPPGLVFMGILRSACFVFVSIIGLVIAILSTWSISVLLFLAIFIAMVITFPTKARLEKMLD